LPTQQDFPDSYFDDPDDWQRHIGSAPQPQRLSAGVKALIAVTVPVVATAAHTLWGQLSASRHRRATRRPQLLRLEPGRSRARPRRPSSQSGQAPAGRLLRVPRCLVMARLLTSRRARPPGPDGVLVTINSFSSAPVSISVSPGPDKPLVPWQTLLTGQATSETVDTGHRYGYCFAQAAAHGYAPTRACGTLVTHQTLDGARVPDGAATTTLFRFAGA
jgi:hypothetical protein